MTPVSPEECAASSALPRDVAATPGTRAVTVALTHTRPYAQAWEADKAAAEIRRQSGQHFDPEVVDAFGELDLEALLAPIE